MSSWVSASTPSSFAFALAALTWHLALALLHQVTRGVVSFLSENGGGFAEQTSVGSGRL
jgi:hypothetical protein